MTRPSRSDAAAAAPRQLPWWVRPSALNLLFLLPMLLIVLGFGMAEGSAPAGRTGTYLSWQFALLCIALTLAAAAGAWLGENLRQHSFVRCDDAHLLRAALVIGVLVLATYLFWYRSLIFNPAVLLAILTGGAPPGREDIGTVTGVTSLVNLAPLYFCLAGYLIFLRRSRDRVLLALTGVLFAFTLFRTYVWTERLATLEAVVPPALAMIGSEAPAPGHRIRRLAWRLGPYAALPFVFAFFAVSEYFRSWPWYQDRMTFWEFSLDRFAAYYYTSLNNGAGTLATAAHWPDGTFQSVLQWLHRFPLGVGERFSQALGLVQFDTVWGPNPAHDFLLRVGDPEFNTQSSFGSVTLDLGVGGALLYFFVSMFCSGMLYTRYARADVVALMLFPSVIMALLECFRFPYWGTSRAFVWLLGALAVLAVLWISGAMRAAKSSHEALGRAVAS